MTDQRNRNRFTRFLLPSIASLSLGACALPAKHVHTSIDIDAPPSDVWRVLADTASYPEWNPYHVEVRGGLAEGAPLTVRIEKPNGHKLSIDPVVLRVEPERELTWGGGLRGIFVGEHVFELEPLPAGATRLVQRESFVGLAVPFARLEAIEEGYGEVNRALKTRAEALRTRAGAGGSATAPRP